MPESKTQARDTNRDALLSMTLENQRAILQLQEINQDVLAGLREEMSGLQGTLREISEWMGKIEERTTSTLTDRTAMLDIGERVGRLEVRMDQHEKASEGSRSDTWRWVMFVVTAAGIVATLFIAILHSMGR